MRQIDKGHKINVEELKSLLLDGKITKENFKLPYEESQVFDMLMASVKAEVEYRHRTFVASPELKAQVAAASKWLINQDKSGLLLCGMTGNGKSTMMKAIRGLLRFLELKDRDNNRIGMMLIDAREVVRMNKDEYNRFLRVRAEPILAIDDIGLEPTEVLDYGNVLNPVIDLLSYRYNEQLMTIITTNLIPKQIREKYGDRIADRFNEMMDCIIFKNESYRQRRE